MRFPARSAPIEFTLCEEDKPQDHSATEVVQSETLLSIFICGCGLCSIIVDLLRKADSPEVGAFNSSLSGTWTRDWDRMDRFSFKHTPLASMTHRD